MPDRNEFTERQTTGRRAVYDENTVRSWPVGTNGQSGTGARRAAEPGPREQQTESQTCPPDMESIPVVDPFEGSGEDPKLAQERGRGLYDHTANNFWEAPGMEQPVTGSSPAPEENAEAAPQSTGRMNRTTGEQKPPRGKIPLPLLIALAAAAIIAVILWVVFGVVYTVQEIDITGNSRISTAAVQSLTGLRKGESIFSLDTEAVADGINGNRYLIFESMSVEYPSTVHITVREREPVAVMNYCGQNYVIDIKGMVLEQSDDIDETYGMVLISGIQAYGRTGCAVGHVLSTIDPEQKEALCSLLLEMAVLQCEDDIAEINISDLDSVLLTTSDGYTVRLGQGDDFYRKLKAMLYVRSWLIEKEKYSGTIDVQNPEAPSYTPESTEEDSEEGTEEST